jgi:serine protease Do
MKRLSFRTPLAVSLSAILFALPALAQDPEKPSVKVDPNPVTPKPSIVTTFAPIVEKVAPSVVTISTSRMVKRGAATRNNPLYNDPTFRRFFGLPDPDEEEPAPTPRRRGNNNPDKGRSETLGLGSGVIVSPEGHILTNNHVIEGADDIKVRLGNSQHEYTATKIGTDPDADLAVLKIEGKDLPAITFADSDKVRVGDIAIAVGNPFGFTQSVTMGIVSALGRSVRELANQEPALSLQSFIQTDASINPGNSGGALVDAEGRLMGINTAIFSRTGGNQGIGFAVPGNLARSVMDSILKNGRVVRGYLGISLQALNDDFVKQFKLPSDKGALVGGVVPDSPAQKAGVVSGDVVVAINDKPVDGPTELQLLVAAQAPGTDVNVKLLRDGKEQVVKVKLGDRPSKNDLAQGNTQPSDPDVLDGVTVRDLDNDVAKELGLPEGTKGVAVTEIDTDSPSYAAGLRKGDVLHEINREPVKTAKEAVELSEKVKKDKKVLLRVSTKGASRFLVVTPKE